MPSEAQRDPLGIWCRHQESNSGPEVYKTPALPTELCRLWREQIIRILTARGKDEFLGLKDAFLGLKDAFHGLLCAWAGCRITQQDRILTVARDDLAGSLAGR